MRDDNRTVMVLTGARTGQTCELNKMLFVKGKRTFHGSYEELSGLIRYVGRVFKAFPEGSGELRKQQELDRQNPALKELFHGSGEVHQDRSQTVSDGVQPEGRESETVSADNGTGSDEAGEGEARVETTGDGPQDSGDDPEAVRLQRIHQAVTSLDREDSENWTADGLPRVDVVSKVSGIPTVSRKDVEAAAPGLTRNR